MKELIKTIKSFQVILSSVILSVAIVIYGVLSYNADRYTRDKSIVFDKNTGIIYQPSFSEPGTPPYYLIRDNVNQELSVITNKMAIYKQEEQKVYQMTDKDLLASYTKEEKDKELVKSMSDQDLMRYYKESLRRGETISKQRELELKKARERAKKRIGE